jgi:hypothetical protein
METLVFGDLVLVPSTSVAAWGENSFLDAARRAGSPDSGMRLLSAMKSQSQIAAMSRLDQRSFHDCKYSLESSPIG